MTIASPTPVSMDKNHHAEDIFTLGAKSGMRAINVQTRPTPMTTAPKRRRRSAGIGQEYGGKPPS